MRVVFMGSPAFALPSLEALVASEHEVVAVVTQPDRPSGRGHALRPPPVKEAAQRHGLPVLQPARVSSPESLEVLAAYEPDVIVVAAYGQILRQRLLDLPKRGCVNIHASLLPRWRGASPVAAAIIAGDEVTGVTIMEMVRALDAGPVIARVEVPISPFATTGSLEAELAEAGAELLLRSLGPWASGEIVAQPQDESLATYAPQLRREDARIDWSLTAVEIWRRVRGYNPWPIAYTSRDGEELRVLQAWPLPDDSSSAPGTVLGSERLPPESGTEEPAMVVQTGGGRLGLVRVQRPGGRLLNGAEYLRGQRGLVGRRLGVEGAGA